MRKGEDLHKKYEVVKCMTSRGPLQTSVIFLFSGLLSARSGYWFFTCTKDKLSQDLQSLEFLISWVQTLVFISETALKLALEKESLHRHSKPYMCDSILSYTNAQLDRCWTDSRPQGGLFSGEIGNYVPDGFCFSIISYWANSPKSILKKQRAPHS